MTAGPVPPPPPQAGGMRWHAWQYTPAAVRDIAAACFALDDEWRSLVDPGLDHGIAHLKLQWWRDELARLSRAEARHPLTRLLSQARPNSGAAWQALGDALTARQIELADVRYDSERELDGYLALADGWCRAFAVLLAPDAEPESLLAAARRAGRAMREVEVIHEMRHDAAGGRTLQLAESARENWRHARSALDRIRLRELRGLRVLGELHVALLERMARDGFASGRRRSTLGPVAGLWTAWRAARQH